MHGSTSLKTTLGAIFLFGSIINILSLSLPVYSLQVLGRAIPSGNLNTLVMLTLLVVLALSLSASLEWLRGLLCGRMAGGIDLTLRPRLIRAAMAAAGRGRGGYGCIE